jgi:hypothetical protein
MKAAIGAVIISISATGSSGTGSPRSAAMRSAHAPAALTMRGATKSPASVTTRRHPHALMDGDAEALRLALERLRRAQRDGRAVAARDHPAGAGVRNRRDEGAQFIGVDQLFMMEAAQFEVGDAGAAGVEVGLVLRHHHLPVRGEAAIVVDQLPDAMPDLHRGVGKRDLGDMARQLAHAAGIDAGGMAAGMVLLDQGDREPAQRAMQRRRAAMDAAADDDDIGAAGPARHRTTALTASSVTGRAASSASVTGLTGGRRR